MGLGMRVNSRDGKLGKLIVCINFGNLAFDSLFFFIFSIILKLLGLVLVKFAKSH